MKDSNSSRLSDLGVDLPAPPAPAGAYAPFTRFGNVAVTSGQIPIGADKEIVAGRVGAELSVEGGRRAARLAALNALAQLGECAGGIDRIKRVIRLEGFVHAAPGFREHAAVLDGASELLVQVFGTAAPHTRTAVGVSDMPLDAAVQLALWAELE